MSSGKGVDLAAPSPDAVDFHDIAVGLANQCRFTGAMRDCFSHYSVAQHSVLVATLVPHEYRLRALLHDAHEAYVGDTASPMKWLLEEATPVAAKFIGVLTDEWDKAIWERAGLRPPTDDEALIVKNADTVALAIERRDLLNPPADDMTRAAWAWLPHPPDNVRVVPLPAANAYRMFMNALGLYVWPMFEAGRA